MKNFDDYEDIYSGSEKEDDFEDIFSGRDDLNNFEDISSGKDSSEYEYDYGFSSNPYKKESNAQRREYTPVSSSGRGYDSPYNPPARPHSERAAQAPRRKRKSPAKRIIAALLIPVLIFTGVAGYMLWNIIDKVNYVPSDRANLYMDTNNLISDKKVKNILFIGCDDDSGGSSRSDSMILVSLDENNKKIKLTSFMRDTWVYIPDHDYAKLNAAFSYGGTGLLMDTLEYNFGVKIDNYCLVDFEIFSDIIDELGGVTVDIEEREANFINENTRQTVKTGKNTLNGEEALVYCRIRYLDSDFYRTARQRKVMNAIVAKAKSSNVFSLYSMAETIVPQVKTDISKGEMAMLVLKSLGYMGYDMEEMRIPIDDSYSSQYFGSQQALSIDFDANKKALKEFIYG